VTQHTIGRSHPQSGRPQVTQAGFEVTHKEILSEEVTLEKWLYPIDPGTPEAEAVRDAWRKAPQKICEQLRIKESQANPKSWLKHRVVIVARKV